MTWLGWFYVCLGVWAVAMVVLVLRTRERRQKAAASLKRSTARIRKAMSIRGGRRE